MSYQKIIIFLLIFFLIITISGCGGLGQPPTVPSNQEESVLYLQPANLNLSSGEDFNVELKTTPIANLKAYSISLSYDPTFLDLQGVTEGSFLSTNGTTFFYKTIDNDKGETLIDCSILGSELGVSGEGTLTTLSFKSLKSGSTALTFKLVKMRDINNEEIATTKKSVAIKSK